MMLTQASFWFMTIAHLVLLVVFFWVVTEIPATRRWIRGRLTRE
jgi:hypothetical protein